MAKGKKTGGRDFKPGQSGNPKGMPPLPADLKQARALNREEFERVVNKYLYMGWGELYELKQRLDLPILECLVISLLATGIENGDERKLGFVMDRIIGKPKEHIEHSGSITLEDMVAGSYEEKEER